MKKLMTLLLVSIGLIFSSVSGVNAASVTGVMPDGTLICVEIPDGLTQDIVDARLASMGYSTESGIPATEGGSFELRIHDGGSGIHVPAFPYYPGETLQDIINRIFWLFG